MPSDADLAAAERFHLALDLFASGEAIMRQNLRRRHPDESDAEIESRLVVWLQERPGAELGDSAGQPVAWPRPRR
jgi:hypothetical protein